jgi:pyridoxine kinase
MKKRVIAVHDISCIGRCSLTVALPVLSAAGVETSVLPTAVLSTHTGEFHGYTFRDLTDDMFPIINHWKTLGIKADAIYTGYLGSFRQLEIVEGLIKEQKKNGAFILIDPVMADFGKLYTSFDHSFVDGMRDFCRNADMIVPNLTEASLLVGEQYKMSGYDQDYIKTILRKLCALGPRFAVLSGVSFDEGRTGAAAYDAETGEFSYFDTELVEGFYYGTGDVFASALLGAVMNGKSIYDAIKMAVEFTVKCIIRTHRSGADVRYGVDFEPELYGYVKALHGGKSGFGG